MNILWTILLITFVIFCIIIGLATVFTGLCVIFCIPYEIYLGIYIKNNNLPKDYRKFKKMHIEIKRAAQFYSDLIHHRKPTFD